MNDCLLCNAASGERAIERLIETQWTIGSLNRLSPVCRGHSVFFTKRHVVAFHDMDDVEVRDVAASIKNVVKAAGLGNYTILQNNGVLGGQTVFHVHFHLVPAWNEVERLHVEREARRPVDHGDFADRIRAAFA
jgi:histidine triad (HIT) family protein